MRPHEGESSRASGEDAGVVGLARRLSRRLTEAELWTLTEALRAEEARLRADHYEAALLRARTAADHGELAVATEEARAAVRLDFARWEAHRLLGEILERAGDAPAALVRYTTAMHLGWAMNEAREAIRRVG